MCAAGHGWLLHGAKSGSKGVACPRIRLRAELGARDTRGRGTADAGAERNQSGLARQHQQRLRLRRCRGRIDGQPVPRCELLRSPGSARLRGELRVAGLRSRCRTNRRRPSARPPGRLEQRLGLLRPISFRGGLAPAAHLHRAAPFQSGQGDSDPGVHSDEPYTLRVQLDPMAPLLPGQRSWHGRPGRRIFEFGLATRPATSIPARPLRPSRTTPSSDPSGAILAGWERAC